MAVGASYLAKIKTAAGIAASTYDTDITDLIESARAEMVRVGVYRDMATNESDPLVRRAIRTFVQSEYSESEPEAKRLTESFYLQIQNMALTSGYRAEEAYYEI